MKPLPTPDELRALISYDAERGTFEWKFRPHELFASDHAARSWNTRLAGRPAFTAMDGVGYHRARIWGVEVNAHRAAWAVHYGEWPAGQIDHINGDQRDNRIANLRVASTAENSRNAKSQAGSSQFKGVSASGRRWVARIKSNRKNISLGSFATEVDAAKAYDAAAIVHFGEFARLNFPAAAIRAEGSG